VAHHQRPRIRSEAAGAGETCRRILGTLPAWFGVASSIENYVALVDRSPTLIASLGDEDVGFLMLTKYGRYAAEVVVMAVLPELHHQGIGRALLDFAEAQLADGGVEFLQVKTLAPSRPDDGYRARGPSTSRMASDH
jgi:ribosomal protein S18 acetylase RimI-like enzyme